MRALEKKFFFLRNENSYFLPKRDKMRKKSYKENYYAIRVLENASWQFFPSRVICETFSKILIKFFEIDFISTIQFYCIIMNEVERNLKASTIFTSNLSLCSPYFWNNLYTPIISNLLHYSSKFLVFHETIKLCCKEANKSLRIL